MARKRILVMEPGYRNKYPPLGLMKLAAYHKARGDYVRFTKIGFGKGAGTVSLLEAPWDRVYVTTLFSFEWKRTAEAIDEAIQIAGMQPERVFVGGIAASLMHDEYQSESTMGRSAVHQGIAGRRTGNRTETVRSRLGLRRRRPPRTPDRRAHAGLRDPLRHQIHLPGTRRLLRLRVAGMRAQMRILWGAQARRPPAGNAPADGAGQRNRRKRTE